MDCRAGPDAGSRASRQDVLARPFTSATEILPAEVVIATIFPNSFKNVRLGSRARGTKLFPVRGPPRLARAPPGGGSHTPVRSQEGPGATGDHHLKTRGDIRVRRIRITARR